MIRSVSVVLVIALLATACGSTQSVADVPELLPIDETTLSELLDSSGPTVVNIWASWCVPCRSEAPLLTAAHQVFGEEVTFIGVDIEDSQDGAREFIAEFGLEFDNYFDRTGVVRAALGGVGVPITYFFAPGGELVYRHNGVIDERTLSLQIDEILNR
ncbi:MAG: TlpA family protein disulfide reductase [Acidimicrobiia bacterium]|nr:TlpA family protein disulfide reductase [Acidimicrobiia bacterium]NNC92150.1 TlpA family protein disulfide reductase [Acidimicrobiia bacterium]